MHKKKTDLTIAGFYVLFLLLIYTGVCNAQNLSIPQIIPASPEASALAKYINYPVSYSNGLPQINIPLYEIKAGELTLPISLSYHASGIKVNDASGWVGAGWTLQAEPMVSRSVKGKPDELGYAINGPYPNEQEYLISLADGYREEEPDEFYYSLLSKSGAFYLKHQPRTNDPVEVVTHPFEPINIDINAFIASPSTWKVRDDNGTMYNFGYPEYTSGNRTAWKAKEIISAISGDSLKFQYHPPDNDIIVSFSDLIIVEDEKPAGIPASMVDIRNGYQTTYSLTTLENGYWQLNNSTGQFVSGNPNQTAEMARIREISFPNGKVVFEKSELARLSAIKIYNKVYVNNTLTDVLIKQFKFYQSLHPGMGSQKTRLDAFEVQDANGVVMERYSFTYNAHAFPSRFSRNDQDHWGYFSFGSARQTYVPYAEITVSNNPQGTGLLNFGQSAWGQLFNTPFVPADPFTTDEPIDQALMLTKITYPTGGYTEFKYEQNIYTTGLTMEDASKHYARGGGYRILRISDYDPISNKKISRVFRYGENEDGGGFVKRKFTSEDYMVEQRVVERGTPTDPLTTHNWRRRTFYSNSMNDMFFSGGAPVRYNQVTEYKIDETTRKDLGKTIYRFNYFNGWNNTSAKLPGSTTVIDIDDDWRWGQLLSKEDYRNNNGTYELILKTANNYQEFNLNKNVPVGKVFRYHVTPYRENEWIVHSTYNIETWIKSLVADTTIQRENGQELTTIKTYSYDNPAHFYPTRIQTTSSDGKSITNTTRYTQDVVLTGTAETARQNLSSNWRLKEVLEQTETKGTRIIQTKTEYKVFGGKAFPEIIKANTGPANIEETRLRFYSYDLKGNVRSVSKENDQRISYIWGYQQKYPIAEVQNAAENEILYIDFEDITAAANGTGHTGHRFKSGDYTVNFTLPNSKSYLLTYWYREDGVWKLDTKNYTGPSIALTAGDAIDDIRIHPVSAVMKTLSYDPLIGVTSITDANNVTTYFEYDDAGRLKLVKDDKGKILNTYQYNVVNK
jgi:YD repeat-containing protein